MAFSHSSYTNEKRIAKHLNYERLEFLGDAVVELTTSEFLFKKFPNLAEGELTKLRASIVCEKTLVKYALQLNLDKCIFLVKVRKKWVVEVEPLFLQIFLNHSLEQCI